ncbi:MAG: hypothetical protein ACTSO7_03520 [Candidatus Heimdallarchaeota archaeon]
MTNKYYDFRQENFSHNRLPVAIDFSQTDVMNKNYEVNTDRDEISAELVSFQKVDQAPRSYRSKIQLGSYLSQEHLNQILNKHQKDRNYYQVLDNIRKCNKEESERRKDFDLLRDFFPHSLSIEVENYCEQMFPKLKKKLVVDKPDESITPRKRRAIILAVFRSVCRKNGRLFPEELLEEVNSRFGYQRKMKLFEICRWENILVNYKLLIKPPKTAVDNIKVFYLHFMKHIKNLKENSIIAGNTSYLEILELTRKHILGFAKSEEKKNALVEVIKHQDIDYISRLLLWCISRVISNDVHNIQFSNPEEVAGWKSLFYADIDEPSRESKTPVRTWKYIYWSEFSLRKKLKSNGLYL